MDEGGRRAARGVTWALALVLAAGCSSDPAGPASTTAEPTASPSPAEAAGPSPRKAVAKTVARFVRSVKAEDARTVAKLIDKGSIRYVKRLRRAVGKSGPAAIARMSPWQKFVVTVLRTDYDEATLGVLSPEGFLDYLLAYEEMLIPPGNLKPDRIRVGGRRAVIDTRKQGPKLRAELVRGSWELDIRPLFRDIDRGFRFLADANGRSPDQEVLRFAEGVTRYSVLPDVWEKP